MGRHADEKTVSVAALGFFGLIGSFGHAEIIAGERGFVTVGGSKGILFGVEKMWIIKPWTLSQPGKQ